MHIVATTTTTTTTTIRLFTAHLVADDLPFLTAVSLTPAYAACELPRSGLVNRGNVSVIAATQSLLLSLAYPRRDG